MITPLSTQPNSVTRPDTFNTDSDTFHSELPTLVSEINATAAAMTALAAGGAVSLQYTFDTTTTDADPGAGKLRLSNATQNTATVIRADLLGSDTSDYSGILALLDDSTSTNKGYITLRHATNATKWLVFSVASLASPSGYKNVTVTCVASSAASPFTNGDALLLDFTPTGDKGDAADVASVIHAATTKATPVDADELPIADSAASFGLKNLTWANLKATLAAVFAGLGANTFTGGQNEARGSVAMHATTMDLWAQPNIIDGTSSAVTVTAIVNAPQAGARRVLYPVAASVITNGATFAVDGAANHTAAAGDKWEFEAITTSTYKVHVTKKDGTAVVSGGGSPFAGDISVNGLTVGKGPNAVSGNTAFGYQALNVATGGNSVAFGYGALIAQVGGHNNVGIGANAASKITTGTHNVFIGSWPSDTSLLTDGADNIYIGYQSTPSGTSVGYEIVIGGYTGKGGNTGYINAGGGGNYAGNNSASWSTTSDRRIKTNIVDVGESLPRILALKPREFDYRVLKNPDGSVKHDVSFIAQEYMKVFPEQVTLHVASPEEATLPDIGEGEKIYGIDSNLVPYLVKAIQELDAKFEAYKAAHP